MESTTYNNIYAVELAVKCVLYAFYLFYMYARFWLEFVFLFNLIFYSAMQFTIFAENFSIDLRGYVVDVSLLVASRGVIIRFI